MIWFVHNLEWKKTTSDPNHLSKLKDRDYLIKSFYELEDPLVELTNFMWVIKAAPYSSEDMMFIYTWENSEITNLTQLDSNSLNEVFEAINYTYKKFSNDNNNDLLNNKKQIVIWLNTGIIPHHNCIQSVSRPHFHFTILNKFESLTHNIKTDVISLVNLDDDKIKKMFCIRDQNFFHLNNVVEILSKNDVFHSNWSSYKLNYKTTNLWTLDIILHENWEILSNINRDFVMYIYTIVSKYQDNYKLWVEKWLHKNFWFSFWITKENNSFIMKIKFFVKEDWDSWGSMELFNHSINRARLDNPKLPNLDNFSKKVKSIF